MKLKVFSLLVVLLLACGCESWDDFYNEHKGILDEGISCEYFYINQSEEAEPITNIKNIKLNGNNEEISVSYDAGENMVLINSDNYYTPYHEIVKLRDKVRLYYNKFDYNTYIENYEYTNTCPSNIYIYKADHFYINNICPDNLSCDVYSTKKTGGNNNSSSSNDNENVETSCNLENAVECQTYTAKTKENETFFLELGYETLGNGTIGKYYIISQEKSLHGGSVAHEKDQFITSDANNNAFSMINPDNVYSITDGNYNLPEKMGIYRDKEDNGGYIYYIYNSADTSINIDKTQGTIMNQFDPKYYGVDNDTPEDLEIKPITFCEENRVLKVFQILGYLVFGAKVVVPLILLILGTIDFAKAVISSSEKAPQEALKSFGLRIVAAIIVFLIPTFLEFLITLVNGASETFKEKNENCTNCLFNPFNPDECKASNVDYDNAD